MASEYNLNYIQAKKIVDLLPYEISNIKASTSKTRADTTVALDSLSTAAVLRNLTENQAFDLSLKNALNLRYIGVLDDELGFIEDCLNRTRGFIK